MKAKAESSSEDDSSDESEDESEDEKVTNLFYLFNLHIFVFENGD